MRVRFAGLITHDVLNGVFGVVDSYDASTSRYTVCVTGGGMVVNALGSNLRPVGIAEADSRLACAARSSAATSSRTASRS